MTKHKKTTDPYSRLRKKDLVRVNNNLREIICVLKDELLFKDQQARYLKTHAYGVGILEKWGMQVGNLGGKIRREWKKLTGKYKQ